MVGDDLDPDTWRGLEYLEAVSGPGAIAEMAAGFVQDTPARFQHMRTALEAGDRSTLQRLAHDLKSNSGSVGARELSALAAQLEHGAMEADLEDLRIMTAEAETMLPDVLVALEEKLRRYPG